MTHKMQWTPTLIKEAEKALRATGNVTKAAEALTAAWGRTVSRSALRHALISYGIDAEEIVKTFQERIESDLEPLPAGYMMPGGTTWGKGADKQKKQEYNRSMGLFADMLHEVEENEEEPETEERLSRYISNLAEDERRFVNRRRARSVSIGAARDVLMQRQFLQMAERQLKGKIVPTGYALKKFNPEIKRILNLHLSDLHIGAKLNKTSEPYPFGSKEESRRLAWVILRAAEWKPQYRDNTRLNLLINGDVIEGMLGHDEDDGEPLAEQELAFTQYMAFALAFLAKHFPEIHVYCQVGNHGRNKLRHEGRSTTSKWNSFEYRLYKTLEMMSSQLSNVRWHVPKTPWCVVPLFDKRMLVTHGDTELRLGNPDKQAHTFEAEINRINANLVYGCHIDLLTVGHFHTPRVIPFATSNAIINGALVPSNGYARALGYTTACGQMMWESVERFALGHLEYTRVGAAQDMDASLNDIIPMFEYDSE